MHVDKELLKGNTLTLVLAVLRDGPLHGYGIAREIERRSENALACKEGTLYPALRALESDGLVRGEWRRDDGCRDRKVYSLTPSGTEALEERERTWEKFAEAIGRVISRGHHEEPLAPGGGTAGRTARPRPSPEPG